MAVDRANIIPICSFRKGKGLFSYENKPFIVPFGGDKRDRTADLLNAIQALSQLSYTPVSKMDINRKKEKCQAFFQIFFVFKKRIPERPCDTHPFPQENWLLMRYAKESRSVLRFSFDARGRILYSIAILS